ncbi:MAG: TolB family protein [Bacteroidota bacterium]
MNVILFLANKLNYFKMRLLNMFFIFFCIPCFAQLPDTDIWLLDIGTKNDSITLTNPVNITNLKGYDNQPSFSPDEKYILYTSIRDEKQSDIYKYDLKTKTISQFTNTATSEYSPNVTPDKKYVSVVMVEPDSTQRLWKFPIRGGKPSLIIPQVDSVGYYCILYSSFVYLNLITKPYKLILMDLGKFVKIPVIDSAGRCLQIIKIPSGNRLFYSHKGYLYSTSVHNNSDTRKEIPLISGEDFSFIEPNKILQGKGSTLFWRNYKEIDKWQELINLSKYEISNITRIAISTDGKKMAIVGDAKN